MSFIGVAIGATIGIGAAGAAGVAIGGTALSIGLGTIAGAAAIGGVAGLATTAATGGIDLPEPPKAPALPDFSSTTGAQFAARQNAAGAGRQGTILTGKSGLLDEAPVKKKTLLGQ